MEVYVNGQKQPTEEFTQLSGQEVIQKIYERWPDHLIEEIIYEDQEVPLIYFQEEVESASPETEVEFILRKRGEVIKEELDRAEDYFPRLEATIQEMCKFFAEEEKQKARSRYRSALEGMEWMQSKLLRIVRMKEDRELKLAFQDDMREYHRAVKEALVAYQQERDGRLAQLFENEILYYLKAMLKTAKEGEE